MSQPSISLLALTVVAAGAVAAGRFVNQGGAYPAAGGLPFGVARTSAAAAGDLLPVDVHGTAVVEAGGAITVDAALMVDATGRVVAHDGDGDKHAVARALQAASGAGEFIEVLLVPGAGLLVTAA